MEEKKSVLTLSAFKELEEELRDLTVNQRKMIADKIKEARAQGDLSENAEYDSAKDEQRDIEARIAKLESIMKNVEVVDEKKVDTKKVGVGCKVRLFDEEFNEEVEYCIVGSLQADILNGFISNESPVGMALIGAKKGDTVPVDLPGGKVNYKVLAISRMPAGKGA